VVESFLLATAAAAAGGTLAFLAVDAFRRNAPADLPWLSELTVDGRGFAFAAAAGLLTALLCGIPVAVIAIRRAGPGVGRTTTPADGPARSALVVAETTLAVMLVVGAGLLARDLVRLSTEDPGFDPEGVIAVSVDLRSRSMEPEERRLFWRALSDEAAALPGVTAVALAGRMPYGTGVGRVGFLPEGWERTEDFPLIATSRIGGDYPTTMRVAVVEGRMMTADDAANGGVMVNEAFVRAFWPGEAAVGRTVDADRSEEVVGVLADTRRLPGIPVEPIVYQYAESSPALVLLVRAGGAEAALVPALRDLVQRLDANLPVGEVSTLESLAWRSLARPRFYAGLFSSIGLTALLLALVGIYGTTAYATRSRTREIGIRMALGAGTRRIVTEVALRTALALSAGVVAGLVAVALAARGLDGILVTLEPHDVSTYGLVGALVLASGLIAALVPARRASRIDPAWILGKEG
jgi:putative ABC transport system permease protein